MADLAAAFPLHVHKKLGNEVLSLKKVDGQCSPIVETTWHKILKCNRIHFITAIIKIIYILKQVSAGKFETSRRHQ